MKIGQLLEIQDNDIYIHVSFNENEAIMRDRQMVKDAFSVHYDRSNDAITLLNEGFPCDYNLYEKEINQVKAFVRKLNSTTTVQVSDTTGDK